MCEKVDKDSVGTLVHLLKKQHALKERELAMKDRLIKKHGKYLFHRMLSDLVLGGST